MRVFVRLNCSHKLLLLKYSI